MSNSQKMAEMVFYEGLPFAHLVHIDPSLQWFSIVYYRPETLDDSKWVRVKITCDTDAHALITWEFAPSVTGPWKKTHLTGFRFSGWKCYHTMLAAALDYQEELRCDPTRIHNFHHPFM